MENQNLEGKRQDLATRLVQREVETCASYLICGVAKLVYQIPGKLFEEAFGLNDDEFTNLCQRRDYEEAVRQFIMHDADLSELEAMADNHGYWSDVLSDSGLPEGIDDVDAYIEAHPEALDQLRTNTWELVNTDEEYRDVCDEYRLDPDQLEVYEHWVVSDWLAKKLAERGQITGEVAGLTIWGRCCTGQSISMDGVIQDIAMELWGDET